MMACRVVHSFDDSFGGSSDVPPKVALLEVPIEEAGCGA